MIIFSFIEAFSPDGRDGRLFYFLKSIVVFILFVAALAFSSISIIFSLFHGDGTQIAGAVPFGMGMFAAFSPLLMLFTGTILYLFYWLTVALMSRRLRDIGIVRPMVWSIVLVLWPLILFLAILVSRATVMMTGFELPYVQNISLAVFLFLLIAYMVQSLIVLLTPGQSPKLRREVPPRPGFLAQMSLYGWIHFRGSDGRRVFGVKTVCILIVGFISVPLATWVMETMIGYRTFWLVLVMTMITTMVCSYLAWCAYTRRLRDYGCSRPQTLAAIFTVFRYAPFGYIMGFIAGFSSSFLDQSAAFSSNAGGTMWLLMASLFLATFAGYIWPFFDLALVHTGGPARIILTPDLCESVNPIPSPLHSRSGDTA